MSWLITFDVKEFEENRKTDSQKIAISDTAVFLLHFWQTFDTCMNKGNIRYSNKKYLQHLFNPLFFYVGFITFDLI